MSYNVKPPLTEETLEHFGVKGMKWGVVKKNDTSTSIGGSTKTTYSNSSNKPKDIANKNKEIKDYLAVKFKPKTKIQVTKSLAENQKKFNAKFDSSQPDTKLPKKNFVKEHKKEIIVFGTYAALIGGAIAYGAYSNQRQVAAFRGLAGKAIDKNAFTSATKFSKQKSWGLTGYVQPSSYTRPEFTLPVGHTFHRLSTVSEDGFKSATYATHNIEDFNRYVTAFRGEKPPGSDLYHVVFSATEEVKVPDLVTVLGSVKEVLKDKYGYEPTSKQVLTHYQELSGNSWTDDASRKIIDVLQKKGYGALVDEMDAGVIGETPLVVFSHAFTSKIGTLMTDNHIAKAEQSLVELTHRKL